MNITAKAWQTIKLNNCERTGKDVGLEALLVYPAEVLPDQGPRVQGHRCSNAEACNRVEKPSCVWAGARPGYDPFK